MTYPITPKPSLHTDPTAAADAKQQLIEERAAIHRLMANIPLEIIELIVNTILGAFHMTKIEGKLDDFLNGLMNGMSAMPGANVSGQTAGGQDLIDKIHQALTGDTTTGNTTTDVKSHFSTWVNNLFGSNTIGTQVQIGAVPTSQISLTNTPVIQDFSDKIGQAVFGDDSISGTLLTDMKNAMSNLRSQVQDLTQTVQSMQSTQVANANSGTNVSVNFADYADGPLPSIFTVTYFNPGTGTGTSTVGISNGESCWNSLVNDADRGAHVIYNVAPTDTDYQIIRGTMGNAPQANGHGNPPYIYGIGRVDSYTNPQNYVFMRAYAAGFMTWHADIGCRKAGVDYLWQTGIPLGWNTNTYLVVGANGNVQRHQLWAGTTLVTDYTETSGQSGGLSNYGSGYRYWGARTQMAVGSPGPSNPGTIKGCSTSDNAPPATVGSHGRVYRNSTSSIGITGFVANRVPVALPASSFDTQERMSADLSFDYTNNAWVIGKEGTYELEFSYYCNASMVNSTTNIGFLVSRQGGAYNLERMTQLAAYANVAQFQFKSTLYLAAGDKVAPAIRNMNSAMNSNGDSAGLNLYFSCALDNLSYN